jgi:hypothetical protein
LAEAPAQKISSVRTAEASLQAYARLLLPLIDIIPPFDEMLQLLASDFSQPGSMDLYALEFVSGPPFSNQKRRSANRMMLNPSDEARSCNS